MTALDDIVKTASIFRLKIFANISDLRNCYVTIESFFDRLLCGCEDLSKTISKIAADRELFYPYTNKA